MGCTAIYNQRAPVAAHMLGTSRYRLLWPCTRAPAALEYNSSGCPTNKPFGREIFKSIIHHSLKPAHAAYCPQKPHESSPDCVEHTLRTQTLTLIFYLYSVSVTFVHVFRACPCLRNFVHSPPLSVSGSIASKPQSGLRGTSFNMSDHEFGGTLSFYAAR